jgi:conjugative relaxase-like TrwC/TraI family protein
MLRIHRLASTGVEYYLSDLARELPLPMGGTDRADRWVGRAAEGLGLRGAVTLAHLEAVLGGRHPETAQQFRSPRATVPGLDLTFSAPKAVSVLFALGGEEVARQVVAAHRSAVDGALTYMEGHGLSTRRGSGDRCEVVPTTGLVAGSFAHGVNRNQDPHLHTHVVVANLVHGVDGRWGACDKRGLWAHKDAASAVYDAHLRMELSARIGSRWDAGPGRRAELRGVPPQLVGEFSSRAADIRRHMAEWGSHSARGSRVAWAVTRKAKHMGSTYGELSTEWAARARAHGYGRAETKELVGRGGQRDESPTLHEHRFLATLSQTPDGAARRRDVVGAFAAAAVGGVDEPSLERLTDLWVDPATARAEVGVAEATHTQRAVTPRRHQLRALGPRPVDPRDHETWQGAARAIDAYREKWGLTKSTEPLGLGAHTPALSTLPSERLVDHLRTARRIDEARQRLGRREPPSLAMDRGH